jgi:hypothetical protein
MVITSLHRAFTLCNDLSLRASSPRCPLCCQPSSPPSSCSMRQGAGPQLQRSQAGRLCAVTPCATSSCQVFDEVVERGVIFCYSITGVYMFSRENHGAGLVSLASQLGLSCCRTCSLAMLLCLALPPAARCAACLHYSAVCCACCCWHWLCCRCHFDCWMLLFFCSGTTTPQVFVEMLQQCRIRCPPLGPVQAATLLLARCSLKFLNHGQ